MNSSNRCFPRLKLLIIIDFQFMFFYCYSYITFLSVFVTIEEYFWEKKEKDNKKMVGKQTKTATIQRRVARRIGFFGDWLKITQAPGDFEGGSDG